MIAEDAKAARIPDKSESEPTTRKARTMIAEDAKSRPEACKQG